MFPTGKIIAAPRYTPKSKFAVHTGLVSPSYVSHDRDRHFIPRRVFQDAGRNSEFLGLFYRTPSLRRHAVLNGLKVCKISYTLLSNYWHENANFSISYGCAVVRGDGASHASTWHGDAGKIAAGAAGPRSSGAVPQHLDTEFVEKKGAAVLRPYNGKEKTAAFSLSL